MRPEGGLATRLLLSALALLPATVTAQEDETSASGMVFKILDLKFETQDLAGAVLDLKIKETATEIRIELPGDILFDFDKDTIRPAAEPTLERVAGVMREHPGAGVLIDGYTDSKGDDAYNLGLSQRRADSVKGWIVTRGGIPAKGIETKGWGEAKPVAPNQNPDGSDNADGRQKNRRVEITVKK